MNVLKIEYSHIKPIEVKRSQVTFKLVSLDKEIETCQKSLTKTQLEINELRKQAIMISMWRHY